MSKIIKLVLESDLKHLQHLLDHKRISPFSLPVRHMLWYTREKIFNHGHVYVDQWPEIKNICALHTSHEFMPVGKNSDFDLATFFSVNENSEHEYENFLRGLAIERGWLSERSLWAQYPPESKLGIFEKVLKNHGEIVHYKSFRLVRELPKTEAERQSRLEKLGALLPADLVQDEMRDHDVPQLTQGWTTGPPDAIPDYFRWIIEKFPGTCLRKRENGELAAWLATYSNGAGAHLYIDPKYRNRNILEYFAAYRSAKHSEKCPLPKFGFMAADNVVAMKAFKRAGDYEPIDGELMAWCFFFNNERISKFSTEGFTEQRVRSG